MIAQLALIAMFAFYVCVWVWTYIDIRRSSLDANGKLIWTLLILFAHFLGPLAWWWAGPGTRHRQAR